MLCARRIPVSLLLCVLFLSLLFPVLSHASSVPTVRVDSLRTVDGTVVAPFACGTIPYSNPIIVQGSGSIGDDPLVATGTPNTDGSRWLIQIFWADEADPTLTHTVSGIVPQFSGAHGAFIFHSDPFTYPAGLPSPGRDIIVRLYHQSAPNDDTDPNADSIAHVPSCTSLPNAGVLYVQSDIPISDPSKTAIFTSSFKHFINASKSFPSEFVGTPDGVFVMIAPGAYSITDDADPRFKPVYESPECNSASSSPMVAGDTSRQCYVHFPPVAALLTIHVVVDNKKGGTKTVNDFPITLSGNAVKNDSPIAVDPDNFLVAVPQADAHYDIEYSGACDQKGNVTILLADEKICNITIAGKDETPPTMSLSAALSTFLANPILATSSSGVIVNYPTPTASDNADQSVVANCLPASGLLFAVGTTTVSCGAIDAGGNAAPPLIFDIVVLLAGTPVVSDAPPTPTGNPDTFSVAYTITDASGATTTGARTVVVDPTHGDTPEITSPPNIDVIANAGGPAGNIVNYPLPDVVDNADSNTTVLCTPPPGSIFSIGTTSVSCIATDAHGNFSPPFTFNVVVQDASPPVVTMHGPSTITLSVGDVFVDPGASAVDSVDGPVTVVATSSTGSFDTSTTTTFFIYYIVTDSHGNVSTTTRTVIVALPADTTSPIVTAPAGQIFEATGVLTTPTLVPATASDNRDGTMTVGYSPHDFPLGDTFVTWSATDTAGNVGTAISKVIIQDTSGPVITLTGGSTFNLTLGQIFVDPGVSGLDAGEGIVSVDATGTVDTHTPGTYIRTYTCHDSKGHTTTVTRSVVVAAAPTVGSSQSQSGGGPPAGGGGSGPGFGFAPQLPTPGSSPQNFGSSNSSEVDVGTNATNNASNISVQNSDSNAAQSNVPVSQLDSETQTHEPQSGNVGDGAPTASSTEQSTSSASESSTSVSSASSSEAAAVGSLTPLLLEHWKEFLAAGIFMALAAWLISQFLL